jgi:hypothetical protein
VARRAVLQRAAIRLTDEITLVAATHVPRGAFDAAHEQFPGEELALIVINAWNAWQSPPACGPANDPSRPTSHCCELACPWGVSDVSPRYRGQT